MELARSRADFVAFAVALAALGAAAIAFAFDRNGAALVMCVICLGGLVAARVAGIPGGITLGVALGLVGILWIVWVDPISTPRRTSAAAHAAGGVLVGWAIAATLLRRRRPDWARATITGVLALTVAWELAEITGDLILDTALVPSPVDSATDILLGCVGGGLGILAARLVGPLGGSPRRDGLASQR